MFVTIPTPRFGTRPSLDQCSTKKTHPNILTNSANQWPFQSIMGLIKATTCLYHRYSHVALFHEQAFDTPLEDSEEKLHTSGAVGHCPTCRAQMHLEDLHPHQVGSKWIDGSMNTCERVVVSTSVADVCCQHSITAPRVAVFWWDHPWETTRENIKNKAWHDCSIAINFMHLNLGPTINLLQVLQCWKRLYLIISWWCLAQGRCNQEISQLKNAHRLSSLEPTMSWYAWSTCNSSRRACL